MANKKKETMPDEKKIIMLKKKKHGGCGSARRMERAQRPPKPETPLAKERTRRRPGG